MLHYLEVLFGRFQQLLIKLMSVKVIVFGVATWLLRVGMLPPALWFMCALAVLSFRVFEKQVGGFFDRTGTNPSGSPS